MLKNTNVKNFEFFLQHFFCLFFQMHPPHQPQNISLVFYVEVSNFKNLLSILSLFLLFKVIFHEIVPVQQIFARSCSVPWRSSEHQEGDWCVLKRQTGGARRCCSHDRELVGLFRSSNLFVSMLLWPGQRCSSPLTAGTERMKPDYQWGWSDESFYRKKKNGGLFGFCKAVYVTAARAAA